MNDYFTGDIFNSIQPPRNVSYNLIGTSLPTNQDLYFLLNGMRFLKGILQPDCLLEKLKRKIGIIGLIELEMKRNNVQ